MNKQYKLIGFVAFILIVFIGFKVYDVSASPEQMNLTVSTELGEADQMEDIQFIAHTFNYTNYQQSPNFEFRDGSFQNLNNQSMFEAMDYHFSPSVNSLIDRYRSFVRGKSQSPNHFTETDNHVIYTAFMSDVDWNVRGSDKLLISSLNKSTEEEKDFEVNLQIPDGSSSYYYSVVDTYVNYSELTIIVNTYNSTNEEELTLIYEFDIENPTDTLTPVAHLESELGQGGKVQVSTNVNPANRYIPLRHLYDIEETMYGEMIYSSVDFYVYDRQTQELTAIPSFEDSATMVDGDDSSDNSQSDTANENNGTSDDYSPDEMIVLTENESVYVAQNKGESVEWYTFNVESADLQQVGTLDMANESIGREFVDYYQTTFNNTMHVSDGKLYASGVDFNQEIGAPVFQVSDLASLEILFYGAIQTDDPELNEVLEISVYEYEIIPDGLESND
ncbi:hypothetical protein [Alkalibacterium sp. MB6]|uniref:hypothetical protein n=1 Tax=Alkalibacterium sp. MB6 TaxID=2081965 RepID=UPI00137B74C2|nr:hypothetical protein [Alkalibacterium sp. MB6]